ncbi:MAG: hypothetical protein ACRDL1_12690 [Solirubrobacterales bacterium]
MRTQARFPQLDRKAGHYESFYIKACRPDGGLGVWIRHTVHKRPRAEPTASIWFTLFDAEAGGPAAAKATFPATELSADGGAYIRIDGAVLEPGRARGEIAVEGLEATWDLSFTDDAEPLHHLPYGWMYRAPLPRTKFLSPHPNARYSGRLEVAGREISLERWPGMIGHNWGAEHAERWTWIQGAGFEGRDGTYLDIAAGRIKLGPWTTPWVANGLLVLDGEKIRLGGLDRVRNTEIADTPTSCEFTLPGDDVTVRGRVGSEERNFVAWVYADPDGGEHNTLNCSIADVELTVEGEGREPERLTSRGGAAYEIGMKETDHGIPVQPFADG